MKKLLLFFIFTSLVFGETNISKKCFATLKEAKKQIQAYQEMTIKRDSELETFFNQKLTTKLIFDNNLYYIQIEGDLQTYDIDDYYIVKKGKKNKFSKKIVYKFTPKIKNPRPFDYFPTLFKFGGMFFYNYQSKEYYTDIAILVELLSFDKVFGIFGLSVNLSIGSKHIGGNIGYQFYHSTIFKNTSIIIGYSYNFMENSGAPYLGLALNF